MKRTLIVLNILAAMTSFLIPIFWTYAGRVLTYNNLSTMVSRGVIHEEGAIEFLNSHDIAAGLEPDTTARLMIHLRGHDTYEGFGIGVALVFLANALLIKRFLNTSRQFTASEVQQPSGDNR